MYWHAIRDTFRAIPRFYLSFNFLDNLKVKWYLKPIIGIYTAWYFLIMTVILFTLATLYIPAWLVYLIPPVRSLWSRQEFAAPGLSEELDEFPPPHPQNLKLARVIISYTERSELEEIVTQALAEQPLEKLKRMKEIIMNGG
jgi:hypothetical protein